MKWFHITNINRGLSYLFQPYIPGRLQKGEDRRTPRICVTDNWRLSLRSIMMIHLDRYFYVYSSTDQPIDPQVKRQELLDQKKIRKSSNDFNLPPDGIVNKEHWFLCPILMTLEGHIPILKKDYAAALMGLGMFNFPDPEKMKLVWGIPVSQSSRGKTMHEIMGNL